MCPWENTSLPDSGHIVIIVAAAVCSAAPEHLHMVDSQAGILIKHEDT